MSPDITRIVLLIEDNPADAGLWRIALTEASPQSRLIHFERADEALAFLEKKGTFAKSPTPDLIVTDLNMPFMDGFEFIRRMKASPTLACTPIVVLSASSRREDIRRSYRLGANAYLVKSFDFDEQLKQAEAFACYWLRLSSLPNGCTEEYQA